MTEKKILCPCCKGAGRLEAPKHMFIGERIKWLRCLRGMSIHELGEQVDRTGATIRNIECGRYFPTVNHLPIYAKALGVEPKDLLV